MDKLLIEVSQRYDKWLKEKEMPFVSKVVPVQESFEAKQMVLPSEQVSNILEKADTITLTNCMCRSHYKRCDNPLDVCFLLNDFGDKNVAKGLAKRITLDQAKEVLKKANENGLIHLSLYKPGEEIYALCSCCRCCCHDLQLLMKYNRKDLIAHADYIAITDSESCVDCGDCVDRCAFNARVIIDDHLEFIDDSCFGCGLCVTACPVDAVSMQEIKV